MQELFKLLADNSLNASYTEIRLVNSTNHILLPRNRSLYIPFLIAEAARVSTADLVNSVFLLCETASGTIFYPYQEQFSKRVIRSVLENSGDEITALFARQCIPANQKIYLADGSYKYMNEIQSGDVCLSVDEYNNVQEDAIKDVWSTGIRERLLIKTVRGFELQCSPKHLLLTPQGWREAGTLKTRQEFKNSRVGEKDGRRETLGGETLYWRHQNYCSSLDKGVFGDKSIGLDVASILGYMLSDGQYSSSTIKFTNKNHKYLDEIENLVLSNFDVRVDKISKGNAFDYYFRVKEGNKSNDLMLLFKNLGIYGQVKEQKSLPKILLECNKEEISIFLNRLFSGDGWIHAKKSAVEIGIGMSSLSMVEDIRFLLHKFGIGSEIQEQFGGKKQKNRFWKLRIGRKSDIIRFIENIGPIYGKEVNCDKAINFLSERKKERQYVLSQDVSWDCITSIEKLEDIEMFDLETVNNHNFVSNGFVVHNSGKTEAIASTVCGLMIVLPQLANMPMFVDDLRLRMFKDGFWVGIFAPSQRQATITYGRTKARLLSKPAQAVLNDADFRLSFTTSNGQTVALSNGSFSTAISASDGSNIEGESFKLIIMEEAQDISNFKIRKAIHPMGAAYNATLVKIGTATTFKGDFYDAIVRNKLEFESKATNVRNHFEYDCDVAAKYNPKYAKYIEKEKKRLGENSDEYRMSYKLEWIISRGMFIDILKFEHDNLEPLLEHSMHDTQYNHVVGIDVGGKGDDTVITVVEVDWNMPVIMETRTNDETGEDETYTAYNTYIKDWHVISNQPDYEEQYPEIMDYLSHFKVSKVVIDATREAAVAHRLRANLKCEVIPFIFSQKSKSEIYKHLDREISAGRARVCAGPKTLETREYQDFLLELGDLQKGYSGANLVVAHSAERGAHDDYPDSWALAVWGASFKGEPDNTEMRSKNPFAERTHNETQFSRNLNRLTARRR